VSIQTPYLLPYLVPYHLVFASVVFSLRYRECIGPTARHRQTASEVPQAPYTASDAHMPPRGPKQSKSEEIDQNGAPEAILRGVIVTFRPFGDPRRCIGGGTPQTVEK